MPTPPPSAPIRFHPYSTGDEPTLYERTISVPCRKNKKRNSRYRHYDGYYRRLSGRNDGRYRRNDRCGKKVRFDNAFTFIYSKRTGTPAASMPDQVPEEIVKEGFDKLLKTVQDTARNQVARWQGQTLPALWKSKTPRTIPCSPAAFPTIRSSIFPAMLP